jgi:hypothetical protein
MAAASADNSSVPAAPSAMGGGAGTDSCVTHSSPTVRIAATHLMERISAASAVDIVGSTVYIIGDDSGYLYECTLHVADAPPMDAAATSLSGATGAVPTRRTELSLPLQQRVKLYTAADGSAEGIHKMLKGDLECMTPLPAPAGSPVQLLALGSGSKQGLRDWAYIVSLTAGSAEARKGDEPTRAVTPLCCTSLFDALRADVRVVAAGCELNLEAAAVLALPPGALPWGEETHALVLAQRGSAGSHNALVLLPLARALASMATENVAGARGASDAMSAAHAAPSCPYRVVHVTLPALNGVAAGLSGAAVVARGSATLLVCSASYEDTTDAVNDGAVLGSLIACMDASAVLAAAAAGTSDCGAARSVAPPVLRPAAALIVAEDSAVPAPVKVEGVSALPGVLDEGRGQPGGSLRLLAVTDPDGGASQALLLDVPAELLAGAGAGDWGGRVSGAH